MYQLNYEDTTDCAFTPALSLRRGGKLCSYFNTFFRDCIFLCIVFVLYAIPAWSQASVKKIEYEGWQGCYELSNHCVRLVVVPQIGGRIMEYSIAGENALWVNQNELGNLSRIDDDKPWRNFGGYKAWSTPSIKRPNYRPDYFYDSLPAQVELLPGGNGIRVITAPIKHLGYQFIRDVVLSEYTSRVRIIERIRNISDHDISWGVWDVTQVKVPCWIIFPISTKSKFEHGWNVLYPIKGSVKQPVRIGNIGIAKYDDLTENWCTDAKAGWMAYIKGQLAYTKHWSTRIVNVTYPFDGCDAGFYTASQANGGYAEIEVMGPITKLEPGDETILIEDWFLTRLNQSAKDIPDVIQRLKLMQKRGVLPRQIKY